MPPPAIFRPDRRVTRAEAVAVLNRLTGREARQPGPEDPAAFRDVGPSHWVYREIEAAAREAERN